jgi:hypothetical protein
MAEWLEPVARDWAEKIRNLESPAHPDNAPDRGQHTSGPRTAFHRADKFEIRNSKFEITQRWPLFLIPNS